jgi:hypothetical protein
MSIAVYRFPFSSIGLVIIGLIVCGPILAQGEQTAGSKPESKPDSGKTPELKLEPRLEVVKVEKKTNDADKTTVQLGDTILVTVNDLKALRNKAQTSDRQEIILFLDDHPVKKATAFPPSDPETNQLQFQLKRDEESRDLWIRLLGSPPLERTRPVRVSVGLEKGFAIPSREPRLTQLTLRIIPGAWLVLWLLLVLVLLGLFIWLAIRTDLLRDFGQQHADGTTRKPYSLARVQAAWWFFLILASYLFIGMITGDFNTTITPSVLVLMGISAATVVASSVVDAAKTTPAIEINQVAVANQTKTRLVDAQREAIRLRGQLASLPPDATAATIAQKRQEVDAKLAEVAGLESEVKKLTNSTENFLLDIVSDVHGVSFHRFQILAWTLILGVIFIVDVYKDLAMPKFDNNLLMLMGISSGTYVALKTSENNISPPKA